MKRHGFLGGAVVALVVALVVWRASRTRQDAVSADRGTRDPGVVAVEVFPVRRGMIRDVRAFTGSLEARARYVVAPKINGRLESLAVRIGDVVEAGQVVARMDDAEFALQVEQAQAARDVARATLEQQNTAFALAERDMQRVRALRERGIASEAEWDAVASEHQVAGARLRVAQAQLQERESALSAADVRLSYTRIRAPTDNEVEGVWRVEARYVDEGAMLAANAPMLSVADIGTLVAAVGVIERDYAAMRVGLSADIDTDAFPGHVFTGQVARIAPVLRAASRQARVEIEVANADLHLRPGMFVRVYIEFGRRDDALLVPWTALVSRDGRDGVFSVDRESGIARFVPVTVGFRTTDVVEILDLSLRGEVVTLGHHLLWDGLEVTVVETEEPALTAPSHSGEGQP